MTPGCGGGGSDTSPQIVVGVGGGIAAYKACALVRDLSEHGASVRVVPTESALRFVGAATFEALSGHPVSTTVFDAVDEVQHVQVGQQAEAIVIAPATADLMARLAMGRADDLLTATVLVATCPVIVAPAMHTEMWLNPATQDNVATLRRRGVIVLEPAHGRLTGKDSGPGRLPEPEHIATMTRLVLGGAQLDRSWEGRRVLITAGGTQENIDPVRYIGNRSSGRQGFALADVAVHRGAAVHIVAGHNDVLGTPPGASVTRVGSARQMYDSVRELAPGCDTLIFAAAVADYRPGVVADSKLKKGSSDEALRRIDLVQNPDILRSAVQWREAGSLKAETMIVGFAAETGDAECSALEHGKAKFLRKGADLVMCNEVGVDRTFGKPDNAGWLISDGHRTGKVDDLQVRKIARGTKHMVAARILAEVDRLRG